MVGAVTIAPWCASRIPLASPTSAASHLPSFGVLDAAVLVDERDLAVEDARVLVHHPRTFTHRREQRGVVGMVVHDDGRVGAGPVQLGVQEDGGGDVPIAFDDLAVGVEAEDVGGPHLLPPHAPRVAPHAAVVGGDRDVPGEVLAPALAAPGSAARTRAPGVTVSS